MKAAAPLLSNDMIGSLQAHDCFLVVSVDMDDGGLLHASLFTPLPDDTQFVSRWLLAQGVELLVVAAVDDFRLLELRRSALAVRVEAQCTTNAQDRLMPDLLAQIAWAGAGACAVQGGLG